MKSSRFRYSYRSNASSLHKRVGDLLRRISIFSGYQIYQEYPCQKVLPSYPTGRHHYDFVIPALSLVLEVMGEQHFNPVSFGGQLSDIEVEQEFLKLKLRDAQKAQAAKDAGFKYLAIPYNLVPNLTEDSLLALIRDIPDEIVATSLPVDKYKQIVSQKRRQARKLYKQTDRYKRGLEKAKLVRRAAYLRAKERRRANELQEPNRSITSTPNEEVGT